MNIQFVNAQIKSLLVSEDSTILNSHFKASEFKSKIQVIISRFNDEYGSFNYQQFMDLHGNIRQLRLQKWRGMSEFELMELERLAGTKILTIKASHFDCASDCLTGIQKCREKNWVLYLNLIGRAFRVKEPFSRYESFLKKGVLWVSFQSRFYKGLEKAVSEQKMMLIKGVIERTYAVFRQIHRSEEIFVLDYLDEALGQDEGEFNGQHVEMEERLIARLNKHMIAIQKYETFSSIHKFLHSMQEQSRTKDSQEYLLQGVCTGATIRYIEAKIDKLPCKGMQISSKARFYQLCYDMSHYFNYTFNERLIDYSILESDLDGRVEAQPELDSLALQRDAVRKERQDFASQLDRNYSRTIIPPFLGKKLSFDLEEIIGPFGSMRQGDIAVDEFILNVLDQLIGSYKGCKTHFILTVADNRAHARQEKKKALTPEELKEKTLSILGSDAPETIKKRIKASLIEQEPETGHAVYLSLTSPYEFQDPNVSGCEGLHSTDLESFKWMLLAWFSRFPYQTISGLYRALPQVKKAGSMSFKEVSQN